MKKLMILTLAMALIGFSATAQTAGSLYEQEGGTNDQDPVEVDAAGTAPDEDTANYTNWKYQTGSASSSAIYAGTEAWETIGIDDPDAGSVEIECDIEMYMTSTIENNKIYFHIGNLYTATADDLTAYVTGTITSNNGQYVGISFAGANKTEADFEKDGSDNFTGKILGGMVSTHDSWRPQDPPNAMDIRVLMNAGDGAGFVPPVSYGDGSHNTQHDVLWWFPGGGAAGTYNLTYQFRLLPEQDQPDGDYYLDPAIVTAPVL